MCSMTQTNDNQLDVAQNPTAGGEADAFSTSDERADARSKIHESSNGSNQKADWINGFIKDHCVCCCRNVSFGYDYSILRGLQSGGRNHLGRTFKHSFVVSLYSNGMYRVHFRHETGLVVRGTRHKHPSGPKPCTTTPLASNRNSA
jgi:hypothetical protein